jgi:hypothetical protein
LNLGAKEGNPPVNGQPAEIRQTRKRRVAADRDHGCQLGAEHWLKNIAPGDVVEITQSRGSAARVLQKSPVIAEKLVALGLVLVGLQERWERMASD